MNRALRFPNDSAKFFDSFSGRIAIH